MSEATNFPSEGIRRIRIRSFEFNPDGKIIASLLTPVGGTARMPGSLMDSGRTLSVHIYELAMNVAGGDASAAASAVVLIGLLVIIQVAVSALMKPLTTRPA